MIRFMTILFIILSNVTLFAQTPDILWIKTFGGSNDDRGLSVNLTGDGGYIITGLADGVGESSGYFGDVWMIKTDTNGDTMWTRSFSGGGLNEGHSIQQTTDGGYIIAGLFNKALLRGPHGELWLIKTNTNGDTTWAKTFGDSNGVWSDFGNSVQQTSNGDFIITGSTESYGAGGQDVWLIKTDSNGDSLRTRTFGGSDDDQGYSVQRTTDGGYLIIGSTESYGAGGGDAWLIKTDSNGDTLWTRTFGGSGTDVGYAFSGSVIAGWTNSFGAGGYDLWLIGINSDGDTLWTRTYGGIDDDRGYSVQQTSDGGYIIAGSTSSFGAGDEDVWLIKTNATGDSLWSMTIGDSLSRDTGYSVRQTVDGGYIIAGDTGPSFSPDVLLIKVAPDITTMVETQQTSIKDYRLQQNYPNPFNPTTTIQFSLPQTGFVTLKVYNILGEEVATLVSERLTAGQYKYDWDSGNLASGVYMCRIQAGNYADVKKMVLLR